MQRYVGSAVADRLPAHRPAHEPTARRAFRRPAASEDDRTGFNPPDDDALELRIGRCRSHVAAQENIIRKLADRGRAIPRDTDLLTDLVDLLETLERFQRRQRAGAGQPVGARSLRRI